jgi:SAM-dependent methyltransferase
MTRSQRHSWVLGGPATSPFAHPRGALGRLAGRFMARTNKQHEVLELLGVRPGERVLEVGYGPGELLGLLAERTPAAAIVGVDPSPDMRDLAARRLRRRARGDARRRIEPRIGSAADTGLPDAGFDRVVSVNTVALWPDLRAGVRELHRVTKPAGTVLLAWHSRTARSRISRSLGLPEERLVEIRRALEERFTGVVRDELTDLVAFVAERR